MLEEIDPMPSPELKPSLSDRNTLARAGQGHPKMARRVIRTLHRVDQSGVVLRDEVFEEAVEISPCGRVSILVDHEAGAGVLEEDCGEAGLNSASCEKGGYLIGDLVGPLTSRGDDDGFGPGYHDSERNAPTPIRTQPAMSRRPPIGVMAPSIPMPVRARA